MRGYYCKDCNSFIDKRNVGYTKKGIGSRIVNKGLIDGITDIEKKMICNICAGKIIRKKIPQYQIEAMNMIKTVKMENIKDEVPFEEEKFDQYLERAKLLFDALKYEDSITYWKMALTIKPEDILNWIMIGKSYERMGEWNEAIESYGKALKINPSNKDARRHKDRLEKRIAKIYNL